MKAMCQYFLEHDTLFDKGWYGECRLAKSGQFHVPTEEFDRRNICETCDLYRRVKSVEELPVMDTLTELYRNACRLPEDTEHKEFMVGTFYAFLHKLNEDPTFYRQMNFATTDPVKEFKLLQEKK